MFQNLLGYVPQILLADDSDINVLCRQIYADIPGLIKIDIRPKDSMTVTTLVHDFNGLNPLNCDCIVTKVYSDYKTNTDCTASIYESEGTTALGIKIIP